MGNWYDWTKNLYQKKKIEKNLGTLMTKADITPGNWATKSALPWGMRNIYDPVTAYAWEPFAIGQKKGTWAGISTALNPTRAYGIPGFADKRGLQSPVTSHKERTAAWEAYKAPSTKLPGGFQVGVKGAMELANPLNLATLEMGGAATTGALRGAGGIAARQGMTRTAGVLGKAAVGAAKAQRVVGAIENLPGKAIAAPFKGAQKGYRTLVPKAEDLTRQGTMKGIPRGMDFKGAMTGGDHMQYEPFKPMTEEEIQKAAARIGKIQEPGMPEAGLQQDIFGKTTEVHPKGKGKVVQKPMDIEKAIEARTAANTEFNSYKDSLLKEGMGPDEAMDTLYTEVKKMETELQARGTPYHGGMKNAYTETSQELAEKVSQYNRNLDGMMKETYGMGSGLEQVGKIPMVTKPSDLKKIGTIQRIPKPEVAPTNLTPSKPIQSTQPLQRVGTINKIERPVVQTPIAETVGTPPTGKVPPVTTTGAMPIEPTPVTGQGLRDKLLNIVKEVDVKIAQKYQAVMRSKELGRRVAQGEAAAAGKTGEARVAALKGQLKGGMPTMDYPPLRDAFHPNEVNELYDMVQQAFSNDTFKKVNTWDTLTDLLDNGKLPTEGGYENLKTVFGEDVVQMLMKQADAITKGKRGILDYGLLAAREVSGSMRIMQTIGEISASLRQGFIGYATHPLKSTKAQIQAIKSLVDEDIAKYSVKIFEDNPDAALFEYANIKPKRSVGGTGTLGKGEELYSEGALLRMVPGLKTVIKLSERHFSTFLNLQRYEIYYPMVREWKKLYPELAQEIIENKGIRVEIPVNGMPTPSPFYATDAAMKETAKAIENLDILGDWSNVLTGAGDLPKFLKNHGQTLNTILYASKLLWSRGSYIPKGIIYSFKNPAMRKEVAAEIAGLTTMTLGILVAAKQAGADVEIDPRSTDFGKIRVGDTRIDFMGGFQPYIRYTAQIITGQRKSASGRLYEVSPKDTFGRFLRAKESPAVGLIHDMWAGETFIGEGTDLSKENVARIAWQKFIPLFIQDVTDAVKQEGAAGIALGAPGAVGASVSSYGPEGHDVKEYRDKVSKAKYGVDWETLGKTKGKLYQVELERTDPKLIKIVAKQEEEKLKAAGIPKTEWDRWYSGQNNIKDETTRLLKAADVELQTGKMTPKQFRLRVDEVMGMARYARDTMEIDPQYATVQKFLSTPSGKGMAINDIAYNEYISTVFANDLSDDVGKYDYAKAEERKQDILKKYGSGTYQYIQQRMLLNRDDTQSMALLRKARETLKPYWDIQDQVWARYPAQLKLINDQIVMLEATDPTAATRALKRYPAVVQARKLIAQQKKLLRTRNPQVEQALVWYR
jgi:hypothetical protein